MTKSLPVLFMALSTFGSFSTRAEEPKAKALFPAEKVAKFSVVDMLGELRGKRVTLHLKSGSTVKGVLSSLAAGKTVHLTELDSASYFGAVIATDQVVGVEFRNVPTP